MSERDELIAEIERLQAIWQVQSFLIHELADRLDEGARSDVYESARRFAAEQEALKDARPMQVVPYLGNLVRYCWPTPAAPRAEP